MCTNNKGLPKMVMVITVVIVLLTALSPVRGTCSSEVIDRINRLWSGIPPSDIVPQITGNLTWITSFSYFKNESNLVVCSQTFIDGDEAIATDVTYFKDIEEPLVVDYTMAEDVSGILTLTYGDNTNIEKLYVITLTPNVFSYYRCQDESDQDYEGYAGLGVINVDTLEDMYNIKEIRRELEDALKTLEALELHPLQALNTSCNRSKNC